MNVGVDIVTHSRVNMRIYSKILTCKEIEQFESISNEFSKKEYLCSRIAAKEAIIKATNRKYSFLDIEVLRTENKPNVNIKGVNLSLSHEKDVSIAFVYTKKVNKMKKEEIVSQIAKRLKVDEKDLGDDVKFLEDLNLDSIDLVEILMEIEEEYSIEIPDEKAVNIKTVNEFVTVVLEEINE